MLRSAMRCLLGYCRVTGPFYDSACLQALLKGVMAEYKGGAYFPYNIKVYSSSADEP